MTTELSQSEVEFTLIVPVYNVEQYLPDFLASLDALEGPRDSLQLIFVIDGSPDESEQAIRRWAETSDHKPEIIVQENGGLSSARNAGLSRARGRWVSFPDPDDRLHQGYLQSVRAFESATGADHMPSVLAARSLRFSSSLDDVRDSHPLGFRFRGGDRIVDLRRQPRYFQLQAASAFVLLADLRRWNLTFDELLRPNFEDALFLSEYLLRSKAPTVGLISEAIYYYRERADGSSLVQTSYSNPMKYTTVLERGYLPALQVARDLQGEVPRWLQSLIVYDVQWLFKEDQKIHSGTSSLDEATVRRFYELLAEVLAYLSPGEMLRYNVTGLPMRIRLALYAFMTGEVPAHLDTHITRIDHERGLVELRYFTTSPSLRETIFADGVAVPPEHEKTRAIRYFGRTLLHERIVWASNEHDLEVILPSSTEPDRLRFATMGPPVYAATAARLGGVVSPGGVATGGSPASPFLRVGRKLRRVSGGARRRAVDLRTKAIRRYADSAAAKEKFRDAWVLTDRDTKARDNAESFYRYLQREQPQVNAWFVINKSASDYTRLRNEGFRVVAYGTPRHVALMKHAKHLIASQIDHYVVSPYDHRRFGRSTWKFTFLQHGVTQNDLSNWLEIKSIDLLLTSTPAEFRSFVDDGTAYQLSDREVVLTGMPRNDETLAKRRAVSPDERNLLLVMPTWREGLLTAVDGRTNSRDLLPEFMESLYARSWFGLLASKSLHELARAHNLKIAFLPHPNLDGLIPDADVPDGVELFSYATHDVKDLIAAARVSVTDYSSLAFESGFADVPVVYFQFDAAVFHDGKQPYRKGYFDYARDGFGPVAADVREAVDGVRALLDSEETASLYGKRMAETFPLRDGRASERTYHHLLAVGGDSRPEE